LIHKEISFSHPDFRSQKLYNYRRS